MKEPESHTSLLPLMVIVTTVLVVLAGLNGARLFQVARRTARDSAHSALWHEVNEQLKAREVTGEFPASLEELPLTYPDSGSPEMLKLIEYRRDEVGCHVSTTLRDKKIERHYGHQP
jgi:hypothetical protein